MHSAHTVQSEVRWSCRFDEFNPCPCFPFLVTQFTDAMQIALIEGKDLH